MRQATNWLVPALGLFLVVAAVQAAAPPLPSGRLSPDQEKRLNELDTRLSRAAETGQFAETLRLAREVASLRQRWQGKQHWQALNARFETERWQRLARLPDRQQNVLGQGMRQEKLAEGHRLVGRYGEAEKASREELRIRREVLGEQHPETASSSNNLGHCLLAQGKYQAALPLYQKALAIFRAALGEQHPDTASSYGNVAFCLQVQGKHADALPLFHKALAIDRKVLGENHPNTAASYNGLAFCLHKQGKYRDALTLYQKALAIRRHLLGEEHFDTAESYNNVAGCLADQGRQADALPLFHKALAIWRKELGENDFRIATGCNGVAFCLYNQGKYADALVLFRKALQIRRKVQGEEHPDTAGSYNNLAYCLQAQGRHADAMPLHEKALTISRQVLGEEHPETAKCCNNLALCLYAQGKYGDALLLFQKALQIRRKALGEEHPSTATSYNNLAFCLHEQGKTADAGPLLAKALLINRKALGEEHSSTAVGYDNLAFFLKEQGKYTEALPLASRALLIFRKVWGDDHPSTAISYHNVAFCLDRQGKLADAVPLYEKALAIFRKVLGEEHPHTARASTSLASCLSRQGKHREAIRCWQAALPGSDSGRLASASSGFERSLFRVYDITPREGLAATHALLNEPDKAWQYAEADLARGLLDDLAGPAGLANRALHAQRKLLDQRLLPLTGMAGLSDDRKRLRDELTRQRRDVLAQMSKQAADRSAAGIWSRQRIQKQIPADAALLLWIEAQDQGWACVLRREGPPQWRRLAGTGRDGSVTQEDRQLTDRLYRALTDLGETAARRDALVQAVRKQRLQPLRQDLQARDGLPAVRRLLVVPTWGMAQVPVEVLAPEMTVSYVPSGTVFARLRESHRAVQADSLLALGDPRFSVARRDLPEPPGHGLLARVVLPAGNAGKAGLRPGDVLLSYNGKRLEVVEDLRISPSGQVKAVLWRDGQEQTLRLAPGALGVVFDRRSARAAIRARRKAEEPLRRGSGHAALPGTAFEVQALRGVVGPRATTLLTGSLASEQQLDRMAGAGYLKRFRLIHLATHGEVDWDSPDRSALILAQDRLPNALEQARQGKKVYDGRLRVGTIRRHWRLDADLVVLSACQTGLGSQGGNNGLLGFAQVFLHRGARSVVLSRWKVDDTATALLMVRFYENLLGKRRALKKPLRRADALAEAKNWLRQLSRKQAEQLAAHLAGGSLRGTLDAPLPKLKGKPAKLPKGERPFAHPFYWAAFVLVGDPD